jgi:hypothetical protein
MAVYPGVDEGETMSALYIVDADGHIRNDVSEIQEYLDPPFAGRKIFFPLWPGDGRFRGARIRTSPHTVTFERFVEEVRGFIERKICRRI